MEPKQSLLTNYKPKNNHLWGTCGCGGPLDKNGKCEYTKEALERMKEKRK